MQAFVCVHCTEYPVIGSLPSDSIDPEMCMAIVRVLSYKSEDDVYGRQRRVQCSVNDRVCTCIIIFINLCNHPVYTFKVNILYKRQNHSDVHVRHCNTLCLKTHVASALQLPLIHVFQLSSAYGKQLKGAVL